MNKFIKRTLVLLLIIAAFIPVEKIQAADSLMPVYRSGGADRFETAVKISQAGWNTADNVLLTYGYNFPDALSSGPLGYKLNAPVLLSYTDFIPQVTLDEIKRLGAKNIYILGGTGVISSVVENSLKTSGYNVTRLSGVDRFLTNIAVNNKLMENNSADIAIISCGENFPDALAAGPYAASHGYPLLLTSADSLRSETKDFLIKYNIKKAIITGGTGVVSAAVENELKNMGIAVTRIGGADRYETAVKISAAFDSGFSRGLSIANGNNYPDALSGVVLSAKKNIPLLLADGLSIQDNVVDYIKSRGTSFLYVYGGTGVISDAVVQEIRTPYEILINDSIVDVFRSPDASSERVTQTLYCQEVKILEPYSDWSKVQVEDGYIGWVRSDKIDKNFNNVKSSKLIVKSKLKNIYSVIYGTSPIKQVSMGTELYCTQKSGSWYQ
ncbi:MAG: cell wall-binding repeat-containing protein, partial [Clostridiaceae bacterium]